MVRLEDNRYYPFRIRYEYYDTLEEAEQIAIDYMDEMLLYLSSGQWGRGEWNRDVLEYTERNMPGSCRVYVRIIPNSKEIKCQRCENRADIEMREGIYCDRHSPAGITVMPK